MSPYFDRLTMAEYHLQIKTPVGLTKRMSRKTFAVWVKGFHRLGYKLRIEYDNDHHTFLAIAEVD